MDNLQGWLMAAALIGALVAGWIGLALWQYAAILIIVLVLIGLWTNRGNETK